MYKLLPWHKLWLFIILFLVAWFFSEPSADVPAIWLPAIFADNMVLQRDKPIPIWGTATPGLPITIKLGLNKISTTPDTNGNWSAKLPAISAGGPYDLSIYGYGGGSKTFHNVAMGDVWFCAGQSNMKVPMCIASHPAEDIQTANYPMLRFFKEGVLISDQPERDTSGKWQSTTPENVRYCSAVAYYFAREVHQKTQVPIGIIQCTAGGATIDAWTSNAPPSLPYKPIINSSSIFNGMVAPIIGYGIKGIVWYKGESDPFESLEYQKITSCLIQDWRHKWNLGNFPCLCVQLPNYPNQYHFGINSPFAQIREAQLQCSKSIPNFYLVVTIDTAEKTDDVHPRNKTEIGHRLAQMSLAKIYGFNNNIDSPSYQSMKISGNKIIIHFLPKEFVIRDNDTNINGFAIAGIDKIFYPANARLAKNKIDMIVWNDKVVSPVSARYAWADNPQCSLYNKNNVPLSPFRTDSWSPVSCTETLTASYWLKKAYYSKTTSPEVVVLGNEQLLALLGADAYIFHKGVDITGDHRSRILEQDLTGLLDGFLEEPFRVIVGALPGAMISDQLITSRALFSNYYKPKLVAITLSPLSFVNTDCFSIATTEPFIFFSKQIGLDPDILFYYQNLFSAWCTKIISFLSKFNTAFASTNYIAEDHNPKTISFYQPYLSDQFHPTYPGDFIINSTDGTVFQDNLKDYRRRYNNSLSSQLDLQMHCFDKLLRHLKEQQIKTVVFNLPLTNNHKKLLSDNFWKYYDARINEVCRKHEADYISLDKVVLPFTKNEFVDNAHLNLAGGYRLSKTIALFIANKFGWKPFQDLLANDKSLL